MFFYLEHMNVETGGELRVRSFSRTPGTNKGPDSGGNLNAHAVPGAIITGDQVQFHDLSPHVTPKQWDSLWAAGALGDIFVF